jgi:hypothetical protein
MIWSPSPEVNFRRGGGAAIQCYESCEYGTDGRDFSRAYMFGDVVENVGLERHLHIDGTSDPNQFTLSDV